MTEELKPSDVLDHAATLIDHWGWCREEYLDSKTGAMCHLGAIYAAAGYNEHDKNGDRWEVAWNDAFGDLAWEARHYDDRVTGRVGIPVWNDNVCKSKKKAVAKLREAAELARNEGR